MSPRRFLLETFIFGCGVGGGLIGFCAGWPNETYQLIGGFLGFSVLGGFADFCLRR
jgi:hypothetical protein